MVHRPKYHAERSAQKKVLHLFFLITNTALLYVNVYT